MTQVDISMVVPDDDARAVARVTNVVDQLIRGAEQLGTPITVTIDGQPLDTTSPRSAPMRQLMTAQRAQLRQQKSV